MLFGIKVDLHPNNRQFVSVSTIALQLSLESYLGFASSTIKQLRFVQPLNGIIPKFVTELGMMTEVNPVFENAYLPIVTTELGMVTEVNPVPEKANSPIAMTEFGISTSVSESHFSFLLLIDYQYSTF